ncbi:unnamed protein product [Arctia plantaginis]|uniref:Uncharacterized protein n=1 Tax=Arctia plantaginis TaxID=874455 RepID=A0A8S0Z6J4_ARCPL|nr:unnamed protein product [Arctia plantaginis]
MSGIYTLPTVKSFFGLDLRTGSMMIAAISIIHPMAYGCTFFTPMSYLLLTIWILVALYFAASVALLFGLIYGDKVLCDIWISYSLIFVAIMLFLMILLAIVFASRRQRSRVFIVILGMLYYILTIYFIIVVNSQSENVGKVNRKKL